MCDVHRVLLANSSAVLCVISYVYKKRLLLLREEVVCVRRAVPVYLKNLVVMRSAVSTSDEQRVRGWTQQKVVHPTAHLCSQSRLVHRCI